MPEYVRCPFCDDNRKIKGVVGRKIDQHLIVFVVGNHYHIHGPISDKPLMKEILKAIAVEAGYDVDED